MNGINLMKIFQRAVGWCKTVYGFKCLAREQKPLSGHVIFRSRTASNGIDRNGKSRNSMSIRVVPRKFKPSSLQFEMKALFYDLPRSLV